MRNSSRRTSPGWIANTVSIQTSVVIDNLYLIGVGIPPDETDPILIVNADGVLSFSIFDQRFQVVVGRDAEVIQSDRRIEHRQLSCRNPPQIGRNASALPGLPETLCIGVAKAHDHA